jgi:hypothetical protein
MAESTPRVAVATSSFLIATARSRESIGAAPAASRRPSTSPSNAWGVAKGVGWGGVREH